MSSATLRRSAAVANTFFGRGEYRGGRGHWKSTDLDDRQALGNAGDEFERLRFATWLHDCRERVVMCVR